MLIVNADDLGGSVYITDCILKCVKGGSVKSVSVMMFMEDSERASQLALSGNVDTGMHLNFTYMFTAKSVQEKLMNAQGRIVSWLRSNKVASAVYNPFLRNDFEYVFKCQYEEYARLFERVPGRIDGHNHMHLCANMLIDSYIPTGTCVRKNISFLSPDKKRVFLQIIRAQINKHLEKSYFCTDYFFHAHQLLLENNTVDSANVNRLLELAKNNVLELLVHPHQEIDSEFLLSEKYYTAVQSTGLNSFKDYLVGNFGFFQKSQ